jgi:hypothetical protein
MSGESESVPSVGKFSGIIPHFHYDVIGRILPGVFFLVGLAVLYLPSNEARNLKVRFAPPQAEQSGTYLIFLVTLSLFFSVAVGYLTGSFLGSLSYFPFEKCAWFRRKIWLRDLNAATIFAPFRTRHFDKESPEKVRKSEHALREAFKHHFGEDINQRNSAALAEQSKVCIYYVWAKNVSLGQMSARWDAESLASRSILFASGVLLVLRSCQIIRYWDWRLPYEGAMLLVFISALFMYEYDRRRQISGRFSLFWAIAEKKSPPKTTDSDEGGTE